MRMILMLVAALALGGCAFGDAGYVGPKRGIQGSLTTKFGDFNGVSTTYLTETELPMQSTTEPGGKQTDMVSTMKIRPDGSLEVTGPAVMLFGLARVCAVAGRLPMCGGDLLQ